MDDSEKLSAPQLDDEAYTFIKLFLSDLERFDTSTLKNHLRINEQSLRFFGAHPPATLMKTIIALRLMPDDRRAGK